jgi:alkylation response protein AidB-like acyl-CoA dehydrogenase
VCEQVDHERLFRGLLHRWLQDQGRYTVILVLRREGLSTKPIKTAYFAVTGTAFLTFDKVCVPVSNTLGKEGKGMIVILNNFNHERWATIAMSLSTQRLIVEECLKYVAYRSHFKPFFPDTMAFSCRWSQERQVFGKPLNSQAVVRAKLAQMIAHAPSQHRTGWRMSHTR